jgi:hypothetical protein
MRLSSPILMSLAVTAITMTGCAAIEGIFKAGVWVGVLAVVLVGALAAVTVGMFRR